VLLLVVVRAKVARRSGGRMGVRVACRPRDGEGPPDGAGEKRIIAMLHPASAANKARAGFRPIRRGAGHSIGSVVVDAVALGPSERQAALDAMSERELDVVVVGGGVVGTGTALDAATRGLSVGLVEARDWASGTSSRSSKLVHGGLRYLEMLDFALVREALRERGLLLSRLAPHLVRPVPFLYPLTHRGWERPYVGAGLALYDTMGDLGADHARGVPRHRHLTRRKALALAPALRKDALVGAVQYYDAQVDDARHTMFLARTAASYGALCASRSRVEGFLRQGERVTGVRVHDLEGDRHIEVHASRWSTPRASGPTTPRPSSASGDSSTSGPPRGSTWSSPATGSTRPPG
jgi:glycerol-3-phosphate dehydrogenase